MLRVILSPDQRSAIETLRHDPDLTPIERDWVEMILLSDAGWSPPRIATHFGSCTARVRRRLHRFLHDGLPRLRRRHPGPPPDAARRVVVQTALGCLLAQERTWTAAQLADALATDGISLGPRQVRRHLHQMGARYRRTVRSLAHKQDPMRVDLAKEELADLKKRPRRAS